MNAMTVARWIVFPDQLPFYIWPFGSGAFGLIAMAGIVTATIFFGEDRLSSFRDKAIAAILFAFLLLAAGWFLTPLGISKIRATPTWCLYSAGSSVLLFTVLLLDLRREKAHRLGCLRPPGRSEYAAHLLTARPLLLCFRKHLLQWGVSCRMAGRNQVGCVYRLHPHARSCLDTLQSTDAVVMLRGALRFDLFHGPTSLRDRHTVIHNS
ncbi:MAG: hypothetical protein JWP08_4092 [Bryobacterales bacterium]|nr:hypothetical protein [Bryobacterales bacterium]